MCVRRELLWGCTKHVKLSWGLESVLNEGTYYLPNLLVLIISRRELQDIEERYLSTLVTPSVIQIQSYCRLKLQE